MKTADAARTNITKKKSKKIYHIFEIITLCLLCLANVAISVLMACGLWTFNKTKITLFSCINLILRMFAAIEINFYMNMATCLVGLAYVFFFVKSVKIGINGFKAFFPALSKSTPRQTFKIKANTVTLLYFKNIVNQFIFAMVIRMFWQVKWTLPILLYLSGGLALFMLAYIARLPMAEISPRGKIISVIDSSICLYAAISACFILCYPIISNIYSTMINLADIFSVDSVQIFIHTFYNYILKYILFLILLIRLLCFIQTIFDETTSNDLFFFSIKDKAKKILINAGVILASKVIVDLFLFNGILVDTENMLSVIQYIFTVNRYEALPLLILTGAIALTTIKVGVGRKKTLAVKHK